MARLDYFDVFFLARTQLTDAIHDSCLSADSYNYQQAESYSHDRPNPK